MKSQFKILPSARRVVPEGIVVRFADGPLKGYTATDVFYVAHETGFDLVIINPNGLKNATNLLDFVRPIAIKATLRPDESVQLEYG